MEQAGQTIHNTYKRLEFIPMWPIGLLSSHLQFPLLNKQTCTHRWYLLSRNSSVLQCGGFQHQPDFFAVKLDLREDRLDLVHPFLQHQEAGQIWEKLRLISRPREKPNSNVTAVGSTSLWQSDGPQFKASLTVWTSPPSVGASAGVYYYHLWNNLGK